LISLNNKYGFSLRIAHMYPKDIRILEDLKNKSPIKKNTIIGSAGDNGVGEGAHSHTEVLSIDEKCRMLEKLLELKFDDFDKEYSDEYIYNFYKNQDKFKDESEAGIFEDWKKVKNDRGAFFVNKYLYRYKDYNLNKIKTRYSSELLWNGL